MKRLELTPVEARTLRDMGIFHSHPPIHKDPFDRMLMARATVDGFTLLTSDAVLAQYPGPVKLV